MASAAALAIREARSARKENRSILHGFISQEEAGCFRHYPADVSDSFKMAVRGFILLLEQTENEAQA